MQPTVKLTAKNNPKIKMKDAFIYLAGSGDTFRGIIDWALPRSIVIFVFNVPLLDMGFLYGNGLGHSPLRWQNVSRGLNPFSEACEPTTNYRHWLMGFEPLFLNWEGTFLLSRLNSATTTDETFNDKTNLIIYWIVQNRILWLTIIFSD